ncbi:branched-chain amino acid ABC transporter permease [Variovorax sp. GB1R11]|uniref:branched-chain amino acid ABC transporter permease n=1 Tax=Variovorax sp. GB1R11 TaxID=3443741 RepID=UPI003F44E605
MNARPEIRLAWWLAAALLMLLALAALPLVLPPFYVRIGTTMLLSGGFAMSWYVLGGFAAYYSFGHTAFIGVGAFAAALALDAWKPTSLAGQLGLASGAAVLACLLLSALVAWPMLRLRGHYFTIAMLAVALVCAEAVNAFPIFKGSMGLSVPNVVPSSVRVDTFFYWLSLLGLVVVATVVFFLGRSRIGYGLAAIREDEDAAQMLGVPTTRLKVLAFVLSASLTGMLGAILALSLGYITTDSVFRGSLSLGMIVSSLVGGMGSIWGPLLGTVVMTSVTELLLHDFLEYQLAMTGAIIIAVVLLAPDGLIGAFARIRRARTAQRDGMES